MAVKIHLHSSSGVREVVLDTSESSFSLSPFSLALASAGKEGGRGMV